MNRALVFLVLSGTALADPAPLGFDAVTDFGDGLAGFEQDGRWGYLDTKGHVVIQPRFTDAHAFADGFAQVELDGKEVWIDRKGNVIPAPPSPPVSPDKPPDFVINEVKGKQGVTDAKGHVLVVPRYDSLAAYPGTDRVYAGWIGDTPFCVPLKGDAVPFKWQVDFTGDLGTFGDGPIGVIDSACRIVLKPTYDYLRVVTGSVLAVIDVKEACAGNPPGCVPLSTTTLLTSTGATLRAGLTDVFDASEGIARATVMRSSSAGVERMVLYFDGSGKSIVADHTYGDGRDFHGGFAAVEVSFTSTWRFIDVNGRPLAAP
jgi:hypothetical protein